MNTADTLEALPQVVHGFLFYPFVQENGIDTGIGSI